MFLMLSIQAKMIVTITFKDCYIKLVELGEGGSANNLAELIKVEDVETQACSKLSRIFFSFEHETGKT